MSASDLARRVEDRLRAEWPGEHLTRRGLETFPPVREGGATDTLIRLAAKIIAEEAAA